jgi:hypothetical protein
MGGVVDALLRAMEAKDVDELVWPTRLRCQPPSHWGHWLAGRVERSGHLPEVWQTRAASVNTVDECLCALPRCVALRFFAGCLSDGSPLGCSSRVETLG